VRRVLGIGLLVAVSALFLTVFCAPRAEALPAFSRAQKTECTTCHTIFPQLNEFGQAFQKNGFIWPGGVEKKKVKVSQTEEERKSMEFVMLSAIPAVLPVSLLIEADWTYDEKAEDDLDMKGYDSEIFAAGSLGGDKVGFWVGTHLGESPGRVFFVARHPLGIPVHVTAGRFRPDLSIWVSNDHLIGRPLSMDAKVAGYKVLTSSNTGLQLSSFLGPRVRAIVGMLDRNNATGKDAAGKDVSPHSVNDFYGHLSVRIGGADFLGREPDVDLDKDSVWDFLSVTFGGFGYSGSTSAADGVDRDLTRYGVEAGADYKKFRLMLGATLGENNPDAATKVESTAISAEANYIFNPMFAVAVRYDSLEVDGKDTRTIITPGILYAPLQCFKLALRVASDSNPGNSATGKAVENTTASLAATLVF